MEKTAKTTLMVHLSNLQDPRSGENCRHVFKKVCMRRHRSFFDEAQRMPKVVCQRVSIPKRKRTITVETKPEPREFFI